MGIWEEMMIISALFVAVLLRDSNFILGIEKEPEATEDATPPSRIFAEWMDEYEVYIKENKKLSPSYCKNVHSTVIHPFLRFEGPNAQELSKNCE